MSPYRVELAPSAVRTFRKLPPEIRGRVKRALEALALAAAQIGRIGGKQVKTIRGTRDSFHMLRVGDYRVMYDVIDEDRVILVLGIVNRADPENWLRNR